MTSWASVGQTPLRQAYDEAVRGELRAEQQAALAAKQLGDDAQRGVGDAASLRPFLLARL